MLSKLNREKNASGASFLELLIIIIIIGILAAIATPQLKHYKQLRYDRESKDNLEKLQKSINKSYDKRFLSKISKMKNLYGDGRTSKKIVKIIYGILPNHYHPYISYQVKNQRIQKNY